VRSACRSQNYDSYLTTKSTTEEDKAADPIVHHLIIATIHYTLAADILELPTASQAWAHLNLIGKQISTYVILSKNKTPTPHESTNAKSYL
jgi:hypothetical protein